LAAKIISDQGIEIHAVNFVMEFASRDIENHKKRITETIRQIGLVPEFIDISKEYLGLLDNPSYGFGANINPCIDCKIFMLKKAKELLPKRNASFVITGEVLGERPMSQRRDALDAIENKSGLKGYLLRPLSAKLLKPTIPEDEGIVNRDGLLDIRGRSRKPQLSLAEKFGIKKFFTPAGGCLLTDPGFSRRLKDLIMYDSVNLDDIRMLKHGRHFRFRNNAKFILGRDKEDNSHILKLRKDGDLMFAPDGYPGPIGILRGSKDSDLVNLSAEILVSYANKKNQDEALVKYWILPQKMERLLAKSAQRKEIENTRI